MHPLDTASASVGTPLLEDFSLEMTGKDVPELEAADGTLPRGTRVNVTFLGNEDPRMRLDAARAVKRLGLLPVPHISARRLTSRTDFEQFLAGLRDDGTATHVFTVGGDPALPQGPYDSALALIDSGLLQEHGVRHVGIAGYPEGHPALTDDTLRAALRDKAASLTAHGLTGHVTTQFGFDPDPVLSWLEDVRDQGINLPVRIGVPGPAGVRRLLSYATRFGVGTSASIARKYGLSLTNLMGTTGPDAFLRTLAERYDPARHGEVKIHFYTFGGLRATAEWIARFRQDNLV
ncbi:MULTISPECIES: methylenetetrahydrofolate reductase [Streptomyces]|uniref:methylenetetrahydrofolate reductase n=1 Tax=Streptomyces TaxID=1883 RepID=UPI0004BD4151|nr:methylenetetrahydrofolate reductase [Streptomyces griseolus]